MFGFNLTALNGVLGAMGAGGRAYLDKQQAKAGTQPANIPVTQPTGATTPTPLFTTTSPASVGAIVSQPAPTVPTPSVPQTPAPTAPVAQPTAPTSPVQATPGVMPTAPQQFTPASVAQYLAQYNQTQYQPASAYAYSPAQAQVSAPQAQQQQTLTPLEQMYGKGATMPLIASLFSDKRLKKKC